MLFDPTEISSWDFTLFAALFSWETSLGDFMFFAVVRFPYEISCFSTWSPHAIVIPGGSLGVWVGGVMYVIWRMFAFFGLSQYFDQGSSRLLFLRVGCECNRPSFLATVFNEGSVFNGDLNQWDVAKVTTMQASKLIRIVERVGVEKCGRLSVLPCPIVTTFVVCD